MNRTARRPVSPWIRFLAIVQLAVVVYLLGVGVARAFGGAPLGEMLPATGVLPALGVIFVQVLIGHVAITGQHPVRWFPWATLSWPLSRMSNRPGWRAAGLRFRGRTFRRSRT